jgi:hypothetical protein
VRGPDVDRTFSAAEIFMAHRHSAAELPLTIDHANR